MCGTRPRSTDVRSSTAAYGEGCIIDHTLRVSITVYRCEIAQAELSRREVPRAASERVSRPLPARCIVLSQRIRTDVEHSEH
jgi:hypothetical protein